MGLEGCDQGPSLPDPSRQAYRAGACDSPTEILQGHAGARVVPGISTTPRNAILEKHHLIGFLWNLTPTRMHVEGMTEVGKSAARSERAKGPLGILPADMGMAPESTLVRMSPSEPSAFAALYRRHYPAIRRYLSRRLGDSHLVEDAVSETFVSALKQIHRYEDRGIPFRSWLYRIATGEANRQHKRAARIAMASLEHDPETVLEEQQPHVELARVALLRVSPRYQAVLALHYLEEMSVEETAQALGCRVGTVKSRLARGREALRLQLERLGVKS